MKIIHSSRRSLYFYKHEGWIEKELRECLIKGGLRQCFPANGSPYFMYDLWSEVDVDKLLSITEKVDREADDRPQETDYEFCSRRI